MRALILANTGTEHFQNGKCMPTCFLKTHGDLSVIQRTLSLLSVSGFSNKDICICAGTDGAWELDDTKEQLAGLQVRTIFSSKSRVLPVRLFDDDFFKDQDVLIIDGDKVVSLAIFTRLLRYKFKDVIVINDLLSPDTQDYIINTRDDVVTSITDSKEAEYPWTGYSGVCKLSYDFIRLLNEKLIIPLSLLDALGMTIEGRKLISVNYDDLGYGIIRHGHSNELIGGSYSKLNYRLVVHKEAEGDGRDKLINEIEWLLSLPSELKPYFSSVLEFDITSPKVYYNVPYYGRMNLREYIFSGNYDADDTIAFIDRLLKWMFKNVYSRKISAAPSDWVMKKHINRVLDRLPICCQKSPELNTLINADRIKINGKIYRNVRELYEILKNNEAFLKRVNPEDLVMIHGDLHFQNIILYEDSDTGFILVDPREEKKGSDVYYDIGKLLHSVHAKYDFIHSDQFRLKMDLETEIPEAEFEFTNTYMVQVYDEIYERLIELLDSYSYFADDPDWMMKAYFAEASHLCSVMTFHIPKSDTPDRVVTLYLTGVILINEFFDKFMGEFLEK